MKVFVLKNARSEFSGVIPGTMYVVEDGNRDFYYLVSLLNPDDVHFLEAPSGNLRKTKSLEDIPKSLLNFHQQVTSLGDSSLSVGELHALFQHEQDKKEEEELKRYWVHDMETTLFVVLDIGKSYHNVCLSYKDISSRGELFIYTLDDIWKVKVFEHFGGGVERSIINIERERQEFSKQVKNLMEKSNMSWNICKCFIGNHTEEEAIKVLEQLKEDRKDPRICSCNFFGSTSSYLYDLSSRAGVWGLRFLPEKKQEYIANYAFGKID